MATVSLKSCCVLCSKGKAALKCAGCLQDFCYNCVTKHRQELNKQMDEIEFNHDLFRQTLKDQRMNQEKDSLLKTIDEWESESIDKIRKTAEETRQLVVQYMTRHTDQIDVQLNKLTVELRQGRSENDFFETELQQWKEELERLTQELDKPSNIQIQHDSTALVNNIHVKTVTEISKVLYTTFSITNNMWMQDGITVAGGNGNGKELNQLSKPFHICVDDNQTIYIADRSNNRIMKWRKGATNGMAIPDEKIGRADNNQLKGPSNVIVDKENEWLMISDRGNKRVVRLSLKNNSSIETLISHVDCDGLAMDDNGYLYVSDTTAHAVRRYKIGEANSTIVAGGNGLGDRLNQLHCPTGVFVDHRDSVYVSDRANHRVMKWVKDAEVGIIVAGGHGDGNSLAQLSDPRGVIVDQADNVFVADDGNHRIMCWPKGATQGVVVIGGNGKGNEANQLSGPTGLSIDQQGNLYVCDWGNHRVQKFNINAKNIA